MDDKMDGPIAASLTLELVAAAAAMALDARRALLYDGGVLLG